MIFTIINTLISINNAYYTYNSTKKIYKQYKAPINWLCNYTKRKYYKY